MNKGFTLVELLAVIIILSIIATITIVATNSVIDDSKRNLSDRQKKTIEEAAESYYLKEGMLENTSENVSACVNLSYLIDKGYVESSEVIDPKTKEAMNGSVKISYNSNQYDYEYNEALCSTH